MDDAVLLIVENLTSFSKSFQLFQNLKYNEETYCYLIRHLNEAKYLFQDYECSDVSANITRVLKSLGIKYIL